MGASIIEVVVGLSVANERAGAVPRSRAQELHLAVIRTYNAAVKINQHGRW